jgi:hypothetical protein
LLSPRDTFYPQKLALTSPTCGGRSVGIVRLRNEATEFNFSFILDYLARCIPSAEQNLKKTQVVFFTKYNKMGEKK